MKENKPLFKVTFIQAGQQYEVFVRELVTSSLFGFIEIADFVWDNKATIVVDPSHEKLKDEFSSVERTYLPMHSILRVDQVAQQGVAKIVDLGDKISKFPAPTYSPKK